MHQQTSSAARENSRGNYTGKFVASLKLGAALLVPMFFILALQRISRDEAPGPGDPIPALTLQGLDGDPLSLVDPAKRTTALLFFSPDCPHCRRELENLDRLAATFRSEIVFLAISTDNAQKTQEFIDSIKIKVPAAADPRGTAHRAFGVFQLPTLFLVNGEGFVEQVFRGEESLETRIRQLSNIALRAASPASLAR